MRACSPATPSAKGAERVRVESDEDDSDDDDDESMVGPSVVGSMIGSVVGSTASRVPVAPTARGLGGFD